MGHSLTCQDHIVLAFSQFALIKPLRARIEAERKLGGLHIRPAQIGVAIFDIALALALAIADFGTIHTAAVRGLVAHRGQATYRAGFQRDRLGQDRPDPIDGEQLLV